MSNHLIQRVAELAPSWPSTKNNNERRCRSCRSILSHEDPSVTVHYPKASRCCKAESCACRMSLTVDTLSGIAPLSWASAGLAGLYSSVPSPTTSAQSSDDPVFAQQRTCIPSQALGGKRSGGSRGRRSRKSSVDLGLAGPRDRSRFAQRLLRAAGLGAGIGGGSFFVRSRLKILATDIVCKPVPGAQPQSDQGLCAYVQ